MTQGKFNRHIEKLLIAAMVSLCGTPSAVVAKTVHRESSIPQHLLNKVLKKKYRKPVKSETTVIKKKAQGLKFDVTILNSDFASWGVEPSNTKSSINLIPAWKTYSKKKDVVVAVIDTGIDPQHPFLKDNLYVINGNASSKNYGVDFSKDRQDSKKPYDNHGHGTHVSGIIKSVFPKVKILPLKYYNPRASGQANLDSTIEALRYAVNQNVDIINYSGGGPEPALEELKILKEAEKKGILIVAAAGNEESDIDVRSNAYYPASYGLSNIITVTAHDKKLKMLNSSNWGKKTVDISAPGYRIRSALPKGRAGYLTGTSQATAFVSGAAALLKSQFPELDNSKIKAILRSSAKKETTLMTKCLSGGRLDAGKAIQYATSYLAQMRKRNRQKTRKVAQDERSSDVKMRPGKIIYRKAN